MALASQKWWICLDTTEPKPSSMKQRSIEKSSNADSWLLHFSQRARNSKSISSPQSIFMRQRSCKIFFLFNKNGAAILSGSYTEQIVDKIPRRVSGLSLRIILNPSVSDSIAYCTPRALSTGRKWQLRSKVLKSCARLSCGTLINTFLLLLTILDRLNPPREHAE